MGTQKAFKSCAQLAVAVAVMVVGTEMAGGTEVGPSAATGVIVAVSGAELLDGETFTIQDGTGAATTFEFDSDSAVTGDVAIAFLATDSAARIADRIVVGVNSAALQVSANAAGAAVWLINDDVGTAGNLPITETVSSPDFVVDGMSGGTDSVMEVEPSAATGVIVAVSGAELLDGETFTIQDGTGTATTFEFDTDSTVTGDVAITLLAADSAAQIADKIVVGVNSAALQVSANAFGAAVLLINDVIGTAGNLPITETVSSPDFVVDGMSGGTDADTAPSGGVVLDGLGSYVDFQGDVSQLQANWGGFDDDVGINNYEYSASTSAACAPGDVVGATSVGTATSYTAAASLTAGTTYYSCVRAYDGSGNRSAWVASDGVTVASGSLVVTSAVKIRGMITVTFTGSATVPWLTPQGATTPFQCNLGRQGAWVKCASGDTFKSSAKSVMVRGFLDVSPPVLVQSSPYALTR